MAWYNKFTDVYSTGKATFKQFRQWIEDNFQALEDKMKLYFKQQVNNPETFGELIKMIEQSNICTTIDNQYAVTNIGEDKIGDFSHNSILVDEDVVISGIGGYPRKITTVFPFKSGVGQNYQNSYVDITITYSDVTLSQQAKIGSRMTYSCTFQLDTDKVAKDVFKIHIKATLYEPTFTNRFSITKDNSQSWYVSIPKTQYITKA